MFRALEIFFLLTAVVGGPLVAILLVQVFAKRFLGRQLGRSSPAEPDDLRERMAELEDVSRRVAELEERVDFAERLLAQQRDAALPKAKV
jgi:hypothetical protein